MELNKSIFKSLIAVIIVLIVLLFGSNVGWLVYESQFEKSTETTETNAYELAVENVTTVNDVIQDVN